MTPALPGQTTLTLLGPQMPDPSLREVVGKLALSPPFACVSAGWQEREGELDELRAHLGADVEDLRVYALTETVFAADAELRGAHRRRQARLQELQDVYRLRLQHAKQAARELFELDGDPRVLRPARRQAIATIRRLDRAHLQAIRAIHAEFDAEIAPLSRPAVARAIEIVRNRVAVAGAVLIAGGHVAALANRLRLLGGASLFTGKPVIAWSAGAMVASETVVLFHDSPPQGAGNVEVFEEGLGLARGVVPLPHAQTRLRLHDTTRVALVARRFAPSVCATLEAGSSLHFVDGALTHANASFRLGRQGELAEIPA